MLWIVPITLVLVGSAAGSLAGWSVGAMGVLLVVGTGWLGAACLGNALRCGRTHCWIDGLVLPALTAVGVLSVLTVVSLSWNTYAGILWIVVLASFVVEWVKGPYLSGRSKSGFA